jgi:tetratricopeptide (TPR) repeat protein
VGMSDTSGSDAKVMRQHQTICLCMIVKNEAEVIERCLASCRDLIDYWVICDTGSTDRTQELIGRALDGIPGELHQRAWIHFGYNRTELMRLARQKAAYLLLIDADMTIVRTGALPSLSADSYMLREGDQTFAYRNKRLVRGDRGWRYVGSTHEYVECVDGERATENLDLLVIEHHGDGGSREHKFERDRALLEAELREDPCSERATFYLAQTYRDIAGLHDDRGALSEALGWYERRAQMGGWLEELYCSWHQVGVLSERLGDWAKAADAFMTAWELRPERLEAVHDLAAGLLERRRYRTAHRFTRLASSRSGLQVPDDILFVSPWVYEWGLLFQHSIAAYWCAEYDASIDACRRLLRIEALPDGHRRQTARNLQYAVREKVRQAAARPSAPRLWPHSGRPTRGRTSIAGDHR